MVGRKAKVYSRIRVSGIFVLMMWMAVTGCEEKVDLARTFVVARGEHYATPRLVESLQSNTLSFKATFNETAIYHFDDPGFQDSKNKLLGFADCNSLHHENSARFAWQWFNDQLEIHAYCYVNGARVESYIGTVRLHEENSYRITLAKGKYIFQLNNGEPVVIDRGNTCEKGMYYMLWPYFGGSNPAPHDVSITIRRD